MSNQETIGFIGLGTMGMPMVRHLAEAGTRLVVYDANPAAMETASGYGAVETAGSPADVAAQCPIVFTCLPNDAIVRAVYQGEKGLIHGLRDGAITCDCSTVSPEVTEALCRELAGRGVTHMDTPMLGSKPQAESGEIFFIVAGDPKAHQKIAPLLEIMGRMHIHVGPASTANKIKLIHNALGDVNYVAVAESLALCVKSGVDLEIFYQVVKNGGGMAYSNYFERKVPTIIKGDYSTRFRLDLAHKDITLARAMAERAGVPVPIMEEARKTFEEAEGDGHGAEDASAVSHVIEKRIGKSLSKT